MIVEIGSADLCLIDGVMEHNPHLLNLKTLYKKIYSQAQFCLVRWAENDAVL